MDLQKVCYRAIPVLAVLYVALAEGAHLFGFNVPNMIYRNFLIEGMCFFLLGNLLHSMRDSIRIDNRILLCIVALTTILCPVERMLMGRDFGVNILTFPQVAALFVYGIKNPARFSGNVIFKIGTQLSMPVYVLHPAVWHTMEAVYAKLGLDTSRAADYLMPLLVLGLSMGCAVLYNTIEKRCAGGRKSVFDIVTPITDEMIEQLHVGDMVSISGDILCGRDAVLPKILQLIADGKEVGAELRGSVIFHTAVSPAGVGPTSSNKLEIESSIGPLSAAGVKLHLGKGKLHRETVEALDKGHSVYAVIPPVTALLKDKTIEERCVAFPELGMEALYCLKVDHFPAIIAAAHGRSIYE